MTEVADKMRARLRLVGEEPEPQDARLSASARIVEAASVWKLFHDPHGQAFASIPIEDRFETYPLRSRAAVSHLVASVFRDCRRPPSSQAREDALAILEARALHEGPCERVYVRFAAPTPERLFLDLGGPTWSAIEISANGWDLADAPPVRFRRPATLRPLPLPSRDGSLADLWELVNVPDEEQQALVLGWLVGTLHPSGPYPLLLVTGEQGSAKSSLCRMLKSLVDPAEPMLRTPPRDERDLVLGAVNGWILALDNASGIPGSLSDSLCRLSTGGGLATRRLYSDDEEVVFDARRPILLNGIDAIGSRPDLQDRAVVINLPRLRRVAEERHLEQLFRELRPSLLGALLDAVVVALQTLPCVHLPAPPRMADFAGWAVAAEAGLGLAPGAFLEAYQGNRQGAVEGLLDLDAVAVAIRALLTSAGRWTGTVGQLLDALSSRASDQVKHSREWPSSARALSTRVRRLAPALRAVGVEVRDIGRAESGRFLALEPVKPAEPDGGRGSAGLRQANRQPREPRGGWVSDGPDGPDGSLGISCPREPGEDDE